MGGIRSPGVANKVLAGLLSTYDYEYLPLRFGPVQCYYEEVICQSPSNVTEATIVEGFHKNGSYAGGSEVEYSCSDDSRETIGNNTVRCLYSGKWSTPPVCDENKIKNVLKILFPTFILVVLCAVVVVIIIFIYIRHKRITFKNIVLRRRRKFYPFVCCDADENQDFVDDIIIKY